MARRGWLGMGSFGTSVRRGQRAPQGLVLSGGGSKASFQLGALQYLYRHVGIEPKVIVGTSAGSVITALLSQSSDRDEQLANLDALDTLWMSMQCQADMYSERAWFRRFRARSTEVLDLIHREKTTSWLPTGFARLGLPFGRLDEDPAELQTDEAVGSCTDQVSGQLETLALATLDPAVAAQEFTPSQVMTLLAGLGRMRGIGNDLGLIMAGAERTRSMYIPGPLLRAMIGPDGIFDSSKVARSGLTVRIATVSLETGELRFMREDGRLVDRDDVEQPGEIHDFTRGVLASCSIPMVFAPVPMDDEHFVDGGVRENLPAEMAMGPLGCGTTYVVTSNAPGVEPSSSFADKDVFQIMLRSAEIQSDETERDEVAYARSAGAIVIEPEFDVHDALTVEPGLLRINHDYGWIRAAEHHLGATRAEQDLARTIISMRVDAWRIERQILTTASRPGEHDLLQLARIKYELRDLVARLRAGIAPDGADEWWQNWEAHPVETELPTPPWIA